ncbi:MAG: DNA gyrase/topoisomerase IV subunit A [Bacteroidota bacterium]|nr:DNA gyrase/topoisomerase IV subunit A [Bacteroidota bacterium]
MDSDEDIDKIKDNITESEGTEESDESGNELQKVIHLSDMFENWFLDYASYVILERAVPDIRDGLKPVQRRILHSMWELEDGRYNKVANIIGNTMKYHPHGDASIGDAIVQLGQKEILIDMQGNWGNILTGDGAAAPRYIEARLSKFANEVVYSPEITEWKASYDGRNKEPVALPIKFPLLLAQGVEGIAVGLNSKILPHNFNELIDASIAILEDRPFEIFPDFITGGMIDCSRYNDGMRGGKVRIRAKISQVDKKTLAITEIPFGTNTGNLIDSIVAANDKGKIKIKKIEDNTAQNVEILIHLFPNTSPDSTIDALYAFTDCEISISPNACVIDNDKPAFMNVSDILIVSTDNTVNIIHAELDLKKKKLLDRWHFASLEKIFIGKEIYNHIKKCKTDEEIIDTIRKGLAPYVKDFDREVTTEDIIRLAELKIKRISLYDTYQAEENFRKIEEELAQVNYDLENITPFAINYFKHIKEKYGAGRERKTEIRNFETIEATRVVIANEKLYVNRKEGFAGYGLKKDENVEYVCDCSDIDDIIAFRADGVFQVTKVSDKAYLGKDIIYIAVFRKNDENTIYNMAYHDGATGRAFVKRFNVTAVTRDKEYNLTIGSKGSKVLWLSVNPNGETETVSVYLKYRPKIKKSVLEFDFSSISVTNRNSKGIILSRLPVQKIILKEQKINPHARINIWYEDSVNRLNDEKRGTFLGTFTQEDKIITITKSGCYKLYNTSLFSHFDDDILIIEKFKPEKVYTVVYYEGELKNYYVKKFTVEATDKKVFFIGEDKNSKLLAISSIPNPSVEVEFSNTNKRTHPNQIIDLTEFISAKGVKSKGKRLANYEIQNITLIEPPQPEPVDDILTDIDQDDSESTNGGQHGTYIPPADENAIDNGDDGQIILKF